MKHRSEKLRVVTLLVFVLLNCRSADSQPARDSVCPTCAALPAGETTASGTSAALVVKCAEEVPLTSAIAAELGLAPLTASLERRNVVAGRFGDSESNQIAPRGEQSTTAELSFAVGPFSYYKKTVDRNDCDDSVRAPAHIEVRLGDGLLVFGADGLLWKDKNAPSAHFYARADLAAATGSYRPAVDTVRVHAGDIEIALYVSPGQLRGTITPWVTYFRDDDQLRRNVQGRRWDYVHREILFSLGFHHATCEDSEVAFALDEAIERLDGQSADEWRSRAAALIGAPGLVDAVWKDGRETDVAFELGDPALSAWLA